MDLLDLLPVLRRRWSIVVATLAVVVGLIVGYGLLAPIKYTATTQIYVAIATSDDAVGTAQGAAFAIARVQSYVSLVTAPEVTAPVIDDLNLPMTPTELASRIRATAPLGKVLLDVTVTDGSPTRAAAIANAVSDQLTDFVPRLEAATGEDTPVRLTVIHPAEVPTTPTSPRIELLLALGVVVGVIGGCMLAVLRDKLDIKVRSADDLGDGSPPVLGVIAFDRKAADHPVAADVNPYGARSEAFRQLRTTLDFVDVDRPPRVIAITSPHRDDGRTTTALNLATSLAAAGNEVCLIEADLRSPSLAQLLTLDRESGLVDALVHGDSVPDLLQTARPNLVVLAAGEIPPNPNELLSTERVRVLIEQIAAVTDYVVIDTAPLLDSSDGAEIASIADATLLVVRAGATTRPDVKRAVANVELVGRRISGVVLTMVRHVGREYGGYAARNYRSSTVDVSAATSMAE